MVLLITIFDTVAQDFIGPIQQFRNTAPAIRMFAEVMATPQFSAHSADYHLLQIGEADETTATITDTTRKIILTGVTLRASQLEQASNQ